MARDYGGLVLEYRAAIGGWAMPPASYARFMEAFAPKGEHPGKGKSFGHDGSQFGVATTAIWHADGMKIAAFFNKDVTVEPLRQQLQACADAASPPKPVQARHRSR